LFGEFASGKTRKIFKMEKLREGSQFLRTADHLDAQNDESGSD
jgi:hypothetical protein